MTKIEVQLRSDEDETWICSADLEIESCTSGAFDAGFPEETTPDDQLILGSIKKLVGDQEYLDDKFRVYVRATAINYEEENSEWEELSEDENSTWYVDTDKDRVEACDTAGWATIDR